jgi:hypothetical protein
MALWGALEGVRSWRKHQQTQQARRGVGRASVGGFDPAELRKAAVILEGYLAEAGFSGRSKTVNEACPTLYQEVVAGRFRTVEEACPTLYQEAVAEADSAAGGFVARVSAELEALVGRLAQRHTGWFTRWRYEILLAAMLGMLFYRLGRNFFYDSWLAEHPTPVFGLESYLVAGFWLVLWSLLLLWSFCSRLRRGLRGQIDRLAAGWQDGSAAAGIFAGVEADCRRVERFRQELDAVRRDVEELRRQVAASALEP